MGGYDILGALGWIDIIKVIALNPEGNPLGYEVIQRLYNNLLCLLDC
jgi:hypothetical protein